MRQVEVVISCEVLAMMLGLPPDTEVISADVSKHYGNGVRIRLHSEEFYNLQQGMEPVSRRVDWSNELDDEHRKRGESVYTFKVPLECAKPVQVAT